MREREREIRERDVVSEISFILFSFERIIFLLRIIIIKSYYIRKFYKLCGK